MGNYSDHIQFWTSLLGSLLSLGVFGLVLKLAFQVRAIYKDRIDAVKEKSAVTEERLKLAEEELNRLEKINENVTKIGASLGIEEFKKELSPGVTIRDIGDNFTGKIAGRDINEFMNDIGQLIDASKTSIQNEIGQLLNDNKNFIQDYVDKSTSLVTQQDTPLAYKYRLDHLYARGDSLNAEFQKIISRNAEEGWSFYGITADYRGLEGCLLVFRKFVSAENFHNIQALKTLQGMLGRMGKK